MSRLEIEHLSVFSVPNAARAENLTAVVPADHKKLIGVGNTKWLGICFLSGKLKESIINATHNWVVMVYNPKTLLVVAFTPAKVAGRAHKELERL